VQSRMLRAVPPPSSPCSRHCAGSDLAGKYAATMASIVFEHTDPAYAATLLTDFDRVTAHTNGALSWGLEP
jgi:hypothetical protein